MHFEQPITLLVVIVNYCTSQLTINCLKSLQNQIMTFSGAHVVVVDNQSPDSSVSDLRTAIEEQQWNSWVSLMVSPQNGGYAYGNNHAIRAALAESFPPAYLWLLNPDTEVKPGAMQTLYEFMQSHPECGIAGGSFENQDGSDWPIAFRFPSLLSELDNGLRLGIVTRLLAKWVVAREMDKHNAQVDWMAGASMIIRREVFDSIGLMDEQYFLYYEETDFCFQAKKAGWSIWYVPESRVMHIAGQSTKLTIRNVKPKRIPKYWFESRQRYFVKNHGKIYALIADLIWILAYLLWTLRRLIQGKSNQDPPYLLRDFIANSLLFSCLKVF
ncbi:glycosyltransferase family 2 protein [Methylomonas sp. AM2-LC]|uniref:glycosyltransferase family 2 protein n=1 Tax=Methylomonas sp. AM2-LC TaxID=3153301 RepID=UPI003263E3EC